MCGSVKVWGRGSANLSALHWGKFCEGVTDAHTMPFILLECRKHPRTAATSATRRPTAMCGCTAPAQRGAVTPRTHAHTKNAGKLLEGGGEEGVQLAVLARGRGSRGGEMLERGGDEEIRRGSLHRGAEGGLGGEKGEQQRAGQKERQEGDGVEGREGMAGAGGTGGGRRSARQGGGIVGRAALSTSHTLLCSDNGKCPAVIWLLPG